MKGAGLSAAIVRQRRYSPQLRSESKSSKTSDGMGVEIAGIRERIKPLHEVCEDEPCRTVRAILSTPREDAPSGEAHKELKIAREAQRSKEKRAGR